MATASARNLFIITIVCFVINIRCMWIKKEGLEGSVCPGCRPAHIDLRSQYHLVQIKERIQTALGLDPSNDQLDTQSTSTSVLPAPIRDGDLGVTGETSDETIYSNAQRQIFLAEKEQKPGQDKLYSKFKMPLNSLVFGKEISAADLWLSRLILKKNYRVKMRLNHNGVILKHRTVTIGKENITFSQRGNGWISFSVKNILKDFIYQNVTDVGQYFIVLMIRSKGPKEDSLVGQTNTTHNYPEDFRPFLVVETVEKVKSRQKRGVDCVAGKNHRCCRGRLTVRFADIGLGNHVIEPREFEAYQCMGTCGSFSSNVSPRVEIMKSVLSNLRLKKARTDHIKFCCTAERSGSQKLIYYNNDKTQILAKNVNGLVVESCDCL